MSVKRHIFFKSRSLVWLNQTILTASVDLWSLIMTVWFYKSWIWPLLSKNNTFYCTLNLTQFSNFTVTLTLSCYQTWWDGLDLTCSSSRGLNFDDFPFFYFLERTSGSQVMPNLRLVKNWEICWKIVIIIIGIMQYTVVHWTSFTFLTNLKLGITWLPEVRSRK